MRRCGNISGHLSSMSVDWQWTYLQVLAGALEMSICKFVCDIDSLQCSFHGIAVEFSAWLCDKLMRTQCVGVYYTWYVTQQSTKFKGNTWYMCARLLAYHFQFVVNLLDELFQIKWKNRYDRKKFMQKNPHPQRICKRNRMDTTSVLELSCSINCSLKTQREVSQKLPKVELGCVLFDVDVMCTWLNAKQKYPEILVWLVVFFVCLSECLFGFLWELFSFVPLPTPCLRVMFISAHRLCTRLSIFFTK